MIQTIYLKNREERRLFAGHLWVYSNEIDIKKTHLQNFQAGDLVNIKTYGGTNLGIAYFNPHILLCARLLSKNPNQIIDLNFFQQRIKEALILRDNLYCKPFYRLIFGDSDYLPGLVVDRFDKILVVQITTAGMEKQKSLILEALVNVLKPDSILLRNDIASRSIEELPFYIETAYGNSPNEVEIEENDTKFIVPIRDGQKTGWFYDQQDNRAALNKLVYHKKVLDVFSYIGAWGIQAACHGATEVTCIDSSEFALNICKCNSTINGLTNNISLKKGDAFEELRKLHSQKEKFDVIVLDPPAFIKKRKDIVTGTKAYAHLHELALNLLQPNGFLCTCSCSMHMSKENFLDIQRKAGLATKKDLKIIKQLQQAPDHPIHPAILETSYLKGFILYS